MLKRTLLLSMSMLVGSLALAAPVVKGVPYRGILELGGEPVEGSKLLRFTFRRTDAPATIEYQEIQTVAVTAGRFSVLLGMTPQGGKNLHAVLARQLDLSLTIGVADVGDTNFAELTGSQRIAPMAYAIASVAGDVPVGAVIDWWRPNASFPVPENFAIANGSTVTDPDSPFYNLPLPNLNDVFVLGTTALGSIGTPGGSSTHTHSVAVSNHTHSVPLPVHNHSASSGTAGVHDHIVLRYRTSDNSWRDGTGATGTKLDSNQGDGLDRTGTDSYALLRLGSDGDVDVISSQHSGHNHLVTVANTSSASPPSSTSGSAGAATITSGAGSTIPPHVRLLKIIRIK